MCSNMLIQVNHDSSRSGIQGHGEKMILVRRGYEETVRLSLQRGGMNQPREARNHSGYDGIRLVSSGWAITWSAAQAAAKWREDRP
jgi:hypothetical protein